MLSQFARLENSRDCKSRTCGNTTSGRGIINISLGNEKRHGCYEYCHGVDCMEKKILMVMDSRSRELTQKSRYRPDFSLKS